ncbi:MAG: hypothetical protein ACUVWZ_01295 [Anaerolineae bacterium]
MSKHHPHTRGYHQFSLISSPWIHQGTGRYEEQRHPVLHRPHRHLDMVQISDPRKIQRRSRNKLRVLSG